MAVRNDYVRQLDGIVKKQLDNPDFQQGKKGEGERGKRHAFAAVKDKNIATDFHPEKRLGILFLIKTQLLNLPDENNPKRRPLLNALDESLRDMLPPVQQSLETSLLASPLPLADHWLVAPEQKRPLGLLPRPKEEEEETKMDTNPSLMAKAAEAELEQGKGGVPRHLTRLFCSQIPACCCVHGCLRKSVTSHHANEPDARTRTGVQTMANQSFV